MRRPRLRNPNQSVTSCEFSSKLESLKTSMRSKSSLQNCGMPGCPVAESNAAEVKKPSRPGTARGWLATTNGAAPSTTRPWMSSNTSCGERPTQSTAPSLCASSSMARGKTPKWP